MLTESLRTLSLLSPAYPWRGLVVLVVLVVTRMERKPLTWRSQVGLGGLVWLGQAWPGLKAKSQVLFKVSFTANIPTIPNAVSRLLSQAISSCPFSSYLRPSRHGFGP